MLRGLLLLVAAAAGCIGSDPYSRLARELASPLGKTPTRVAVLPFRGLDPALDAEGEAISERLLSYLYGHGGVVLIERSRLQLLMSEMSLGQTGALDSKSVAELGRLSGAQALVVGTVARDQKGLALSARVVDVKSGRLLAAATAHFPEGRNLVTPRPPASPVHPAPTRPQPAVRLPKEGGRGAGADLGDGARAPWPLAVFGAVSAAGRIYVIGGATERVAAGRGEPTVFSASVTGRGPLGRWRAEEPLPQGRYQVGAAVWGDWVFAVGGHEGSPRDEVFSARVGSDGVLSPWKEAARLPTGCTFPGVAAAAGRLHVAGCTSASGTVYAVFSAAVGADGVLGGWVRTPLPVEAGAGSTLVSDGRRLLLVGGTLEGGGYTDAVYAVPLTRLGQANAAVRIGTLPQPMVGAAAAVSGGRLWLLGGKLRPARDDELSDAMESAALVGEGLGPWRRSAQRISPRAFNAFAPLVDGAFYLVGGETPSGRGDLVQRLPIR